MIYRAWTCESEHKCVYELTVPHLLCRFECYIRRASAKFALCQYYLESLSRKDLSQSESISSHFLAYLEENNGFWRKLSQHTILLTIVPNFPVGSVFNLVICPLFRRRAKIWPEQRLPNKICLKIIGNLALEIRHGYKTAISNRCRPISVTCFIESSKRCERIRGLSPIMFENTQVCLRSYSQ